MTAVIPADADDLDALSAIIADAFHDLPPSPWLIADEASRRRIFPDYFRIYVEHALAAGAVHTTPHRNAVALWIPVGSEPPALPDDYPERLADITKPWTARFVQFDAALDVCHPTGFPHHYLAFLAVRPDRQGQGIGTALLTYHHLLLDRTGIIAYLEASSPRNRQLYLRHGYADHGSPIQLPGGPEMYPMVKEPQLPARRRPPLRAESRQR
jgi:GNAT superfamily N-acetyltransferase